MSFKVVGLGEILWDLLPAGAQLGGAPGNFACHARALGADAGIVTRVGDDPLGREILRRLEAMGLPLGLVQIDPAAPTGTVGVQLDSAGVPQFTIHAGVAWDRLEAKEAALVAVAQADAICFGSLAQRAEPSRGTIRELLCAAPAGALRIFDVNLRQHFYSRELLEHSLHLASVLKLNEAELPVIAGMFGVAGDERAQVAALAARFGFRVVALTRGPRGAVLWADGRWSEWVPAPVAVADTVGAGDAFTAALALGLLQRRDPDEINRLANAVARHVCSLPGATPPLPAELQAKFA